MLNPDPDTSHVQIPVHGPWKSLNARAPRLPIEHAGKVVLVDDGQPRDYIVETWDPIGDGRWGHTIAEVTAGAGDIHAALSAPGRTIRVTALG